MCIRDSHPYMPQLHRIRALRDIPGAGVAKGDLGGWIEREANLDQSGSAWVYDNAWVYGDARVLDNAMVLGYARVFDTAWVSGDAWVYGNAMVYGNAGVFGNAWVYGDARVLDNAWVHGDAMVLDNAMVSSADEVLHALVMGSALFRATLYKTADSHTLRVGCWSGTVPEFRTMIESDRWVNATPEQIKERRPEMLAFASMCEARITTWGERDNND